MSEAPIEEETPAADSAGWMCGSGERGGGCAWGLRSPESPRGDAPLASGRMVDAGGPFGSKHPFGVLDQEGEHFSSRPLLHQRRVLAGPEGNQVEHTGAPRSATEGHRQSILPGIV